MDSKPFHAVASAAASISAVFMLVMAYEFGFMPGGLFDDAALVGVPLWVIVAGLSVSLTWLSFAHVRWFIQGSAQKVSFQRRTTRAG